MKAEIILCAGSRRRRGDILSMLARKEWTDARSKASLSNVRNARREERITAILIFGDMGNLIVGTARVERGAKDAAD